MNYPDVTIGSVKVPWPALAGLLAAAPLVAVFGLRAMTHTPSLSPASSSDVLVQGAFTPPTLPQPTPELVALQRTFDAECSQPFAASPMMSKAPPPELKRPVEVVKRPDVIEKPTPTPQAATPPALTLTSIMSGNGKPFAVVSGKVRRVGDSVGSGFVITEIDPVTGTVDIGNNAGVTSQLRLKNHGGE